MIEKLANLPQRVESSLLLRTVYQPFTILAVVLGWVLFRAADLSAAVKYLKALFSLGVGAAPGLAVYQLGEIATVMCFGLLLSTPLVRDLRRRFDGSVLVAATDGLLQLVFFVCGASYLVISAYNPFIYFNF